MAAKAGPPLLEVEQVKDVTLVKLNRRNILEEDTTEEIGSQLFSLLNDLGCRNLILNFDRVERLTSVMLGKVVQLHRRAQEAGGRVMLCNIQPRVYEIFELLRLPRVLNICAEEQPALRAF